MVLLSSWAPGEVGRSQEVWGSLALTDVDQETKLSGGDWQLPNSITGK